MSDTDSFIDEVTEEVRRDRLFLLLRRYGWVGIVVVVGIVGGAAWREYTRAQDDASAQALGDAMTAALQLDEPEARAAALAAVESGQPTARALVRMAEAGALIEEGKTTQAAKLLNSITTDADVPQIYRDVAAFKALAQSRESLSLDERRIQYEALAKPGAPLNLLAQEQLALLDIEAGEAGAAVTRLQEIAQSAEISRDMRERVNQMIIALGGAV